MGKQSINTLKAWFKKGLKPLETQFNDWLDSYWHKDDTNIPIDSIQNLQNTLNSFPSIETINALLEQKADLNYQGASPSTVSIGGVPAGTVLTGRTNESILEQILVQYLQPAFTSFVIVGQALTVEVGATIAGAIKTVTWGTSNQINIAVNSLKIRNVNTSADLITSLSNDGNELVTFGSVTLNTKGQTQTYRIIGTNSKLATFQLDFIITAQYQIFYDSVSAAPTDSDSVRALAHARFANAGNVWNIDTGVVNRRFVFAIPATFNVVSIIDLDALNANITASYIITTFNVKDAAGNSVLYKIGVMTQAVNYTPTSHRHQITIS